MHIEARTGHKVAVANEMKSHNRDKKLIPENVEGFMM